MQLCSTVTSILTLKCYQIILKLHQAGFSIRETKKEFIRLAGKKILLHYCDNLQHVLDYREFEVAASTLFLICRSHI